MLTLAAKVIIIVTVILGVLAIVAVGLRIYCRRLQSIPLGVDDYFMVVALVLSTGVSVLSDYTAATFDIGDPSYVLTLPQLIFAMKITYAAELAQILSIGLVKISMLIFYRRIFVLDWFLKWNAVLIALVSTFTTAIMLSVTFSKWPIRNQWNPEARYNISPAGILLSFVVINLVFDILTLAMPLIAIRNLHMAAQIKLVLFTIFVMGSACIAASICRLVYASEFIHTTPTINSPYEAPFYLNDLWAIVEIPVFVIAGCLLTFGPLFRSHQHACSNSRSLRSRFLREQSRSGSETSMESGAAAIKRTVTVTNEVKASNDPYDSAPDVAPYERTYGNLAHVTQISPYSLSRVSNDRACERLI